MALGKIAGKPTQLIDERGGTESIKEDAGELKRIAAGHGSLADKAGEAVEALKVPGAPNGPTIN